MEEGDRNCLFPRSKKHLSPLNHISLPSFDLHLSPNMFNQLKNAAASFSQNQGGSNTQQNQQSNGGQTSNTASSGGDALDKGSESELCHSRTKMDS